MSKIESRKKMKDIAVTKMVIEAEISANMAAIKAENKFSDVGFSRFAAEISVAGCRAVSGMMVNQIIQTPASIFMPDKPKIDKRREKRMRAKYRAIKVSINELD